ncbi:hypothetical protein M0R45_033237 [Rubus argutus]|uniref:Uncharacterized protein n=1 Tax=Rubus argutus TaxID=59490 RepID=A0AAW1WJK8_RUBAR
MLLQSPKVQTKVRWQNSYAESLFNLYNQLEDPYSRFYVYLSSLNLAINGKVTEHALPSFKQMESFLKEWNIGVSDQRQLLLTISNVLKEHKSLAKESFKFLTKHLTCFSVIC